MTDQNHTLTLQPRLIGKILFAVAAVISAFTLIGKYLTLFANSFRLNSPAGTYILNNYFILEFRLNTESNIIIYFTAFILLAAATALFFMIALYKNAVKDAFKSSWFALAAVFLFLSVYTASPLPEKHVKFYYEGWTSRMGWFEFRWAVIIVTLTILGLLFRRFFLHLESKSRNLLFASIILYYAGMLGVELFSGRYTDLFKNQNLGLAVVLSMAELAELGGLILMIYALLRYMETYLSDIRFLTQPKEQSNREYIQAFQPRRIVQAFVVTAFVFSLLSFIGQILRLFPDYYSINSPLEESLLSILIYQFGVNTEANVATYFATIILVIASALFLVIALLKYAIKDRQRLGWLVLCLFVLYLSIDEQCVLHEKLSWLFSSWTNLNGWLEYKWLIPGITGVIIFAVLFIPFFLHLDTRFKALFIASAIMYFSGALGSEIFSGRYASTHGVKNITYSIMTTIEELLEFNGVNLLIYSLLHYIEIYFGEARLMIGAKKS